MSTLNYIDARTQLNKSRKYRRQLELRRKIFLAALTITLIVSFIISYHAIISQASANTDNVSFKYFTSIKVANGDSLWSIAQTYMDDEHYDSVQEYINEVKFTNHLEDDFIYAGQYLIVPYFSHEYVE